MLRTPSYFYPVPNASAVLGKWLFTCSLLSIIPVFLVMHNAFQAFLKHTLRQFPIKGIYHFLSAKAPWRGWALLEKSHWILFIPSVGWGCGCLMGNVLQYDPVIKWEMPHGWFDEWA